MVQNTFNIFNTFNISAIPSTFFEHGPPGINIFNISAVSCVFFFFFFENMLETTDMLKGMVPNLLIWFRTARSIQKIHSPEKRGPHAICLLGVTRLGEEKGVLAIFVVFWGGEYTKKANLRSLIVLCVPIFGLFLSCLWGLRPLLGQTCGQQIGHEHKCRRGHLQGGKA